MASIRKLKSGKYHVEIRIKGHAPLRATFDRLTDAKVWAKKTESDIQLGKHLNLKAKKYTLNMLIDKYLIEELPKRNSDIKKFKMQLEWWRNEIGAYYLSAISPEMLSNCKNKLLTEPTTKPQKGRLNRSPATVNRYMACISIVFSKAVKEWGLLDKNPMSFISKEKESRGRIRFLSNEEQEKLLNACKEISEDLFLFVLIAITSGARYSEILHLKWQDIDFKNSQFHFIETKNNESRGVPMVSVVADKLKEKNKVRNLKSDYIFSTPNGKLKYMRGQFYNAIEKTNIKDFHFHDLRHTAASYLAMNGASLLEIAEILGHKTLAMVKRYSHLTVKHTAKLIEDTASKNIYKNL